MQSVGTGGRNHLVRARNAEQPLTPTSLAQTTLRRSPVSGPPATSDYAAALLQLCAHN
jgi:hypothetical protein